MSSVKRRRSHIKSESPTKRIKSNSAATATTPATLRFVSFLEHESTHDWVALFQIDGLAKDHEPEGALTRHMPFVALERPGQAPRQKLVLVPLSRINYLVRYAEHLGYTCPEKPSGIKALFGDVFVDVKPRRRKEERRRRRKLQSRQSLQSTLDLPPPDQPEGHGDQALLQQMLREISGDHVQDSDAVVTPLRETVESLFGPSSSSEPEDGMADDTSMGTSTPTK